MRGNRGAGRKGALIRAAGFLLPASAAAPFVTWRFAGTGARLRHRYLAA